MVCLLRDILVIDLLLVIIIYLVVIFLYNMVLLYSFMFMNIIFFIGMLNNFLVEFLLEELVCFLILRLERVRICCSFIYKFLFFIFVLLDLLRFIYV